MLTIYLNIHCVHGVLFANLFCKRHLKNEYVAASTFSFIPDRINQCIKQHISSSIDFLMLKPLDLKFLLTVLYAEALYLLDVLFYLVLLLSSCSKTEQFHLSIFIIDQLAQAKGY